MIDPPVAPRSAAEGLPKVVRDRYVLTPLSRGLLAFATAIAALSAVSVVYCAWVVAGFLHAPDGAAQQGGFEVSHESMFWVRALIKYAAICIVGIVTALGVAARALLSAKRPPP